MQEVPASSPQRAGDRERGCKQLGTASVNKLRSKLIQREGGNDFFICAEHVKARIAAEANEIQYMLRYALCFK